MLSPVNVVGDVTRTLETLLGELSPSLGSPADVDIGEAEAGSINIYLYQVLESPHGKNRVWSTRPNGERESPPLQLRLYYLLTPFGGDLLTEHHVLGDAMRTLYDHAIVRGADLPASLRQRVDQIAIVLMPLGLEEMTRIWSALQAAYRLSVAYEVRVIPVQSDVVVTPSRVLTTVQRFART